MADPAKSTVIGMEAYESQLAKLPLYVEKPLLKDAAKSSMGVMAAAAQANAPKKTNQLAQAIRVRMGKARQGFSVIVAAARRWFTGPTFYGGFQEFGWKAGKRKRPVSSMAKRLETKYRSQSRANVAMPGAYSLAKKGTAIREVQEARFKKRAARDAVKLTANRREIPGKHFVQRAYEDTAPQVMKQFTESVKAGLDAELGNK